MLHYAIPWQLVSQRHCETSCCREKIAQYNTVADPRGGGGIGGLCPPPFWILFFLQKRSLLAKLLLNEHKICLEMLEMAILETQIFKNFWGSMHPDPPRKLAPSALVSAPPFANPGSASVTEPLLTTRLHTPLCATETLSTLPLQE